MRSWLRSGFQFAAAALVAFAAPGSAPAQFIFQREYFGRHGGLRGPAPIVRVQSTPVVVRQVQENRDDDEGLRGSAPPARLQVQVPPGIAGERNDAIKQAIADCRVLLEGGTRTPADEFRVAIGKAVVLRVGNDPAHPIGKADLSDVLPSRAVVWNYPPESLFRIVHEDTTRAVLVLEPKAAGTHVVSAVVLPTTELLPPPVKAPETTDASKEAKKNGEHAKSDKEPEKQPDAPPRPALNRGSVRFVNFTIHVGGAPIKPIVGPKDAPKDDAPASLEAALQAVKAAYAEERNVRAVGVLKFRLSTLGTTGAKQALAQALDAAQNVIASSKTLAAVKDALAVAPVPTTDAALQARVAQIAEQLRD